MAPLFLVLLAAVSVFAVPHYGDDDYSDRIIGGTPTGIEEFPFLAGLIYTKRSTGKIVQNNLCGATIISEYWVLTAAHCTRPMKLTSGEHIYLSDVRAGTSYSTKGGIMLPVRKVVPHKYPPNNIALIELDEPWPLNGVTISIARLPRQDAPIPVNKLATIVGWGYIDEKKTPSSILMKEEVLVISVSGCNSRVSSWTNNKVRVTDASICTESHPMKKVSSAYLNDYGSPVLVGGEVVGIVSWFASNKPTFVPNVHTRISLYVDWIEDIVGRLPRGHY